MASFRIPQYCIAAALIVSVAAVSLALAKPPRRAATEPSPAPVAAAPIPQALLAGAAKPFPVLNSAALKFTLPDNIAWVESPAGSAQAVMAGDPNKPGLYVLLTRWHAHHMSHPHFHPNDRYIVVLSGTWWVGTGTKFDPDSTVAMPPGTFVTHIGKQIHYDGAKDGDVTLEIVGMGPATNTPAEEK